MTDHPILYAHLQTLGRVVLGYSGGVDSALLAVAGTRALGRENFLAVIGRSASYPEDQYDTAFQLAREFGIPVRELDTRELSDPRYLGNSTERCYFCKSELWTRLVELAKELGFDTVIDGTNADDLGEHRPGLRASREQAIRSPLAELGWTKARVRAAAHSFGLPTWNAPAAPCLSSRVMYGLGITPERLRQVELGESFLRSIGVSGASASPASVWILPISVKRPVATTTASPCPPVTSVPMYTMFTRSPKGRSGRTSGAVTLLTGTLSPVSTDSSTLNHWASIRRPSAAM